MIVKDLAPSGGSFQSVMDYISHEGKALTVRTSDELISLGSAPTEMYATASLARRLASPNNALVHFTVAWSPSEKIDEEDAIRASEQILSAIDLRDGHQYIIAVHGDRPHRHTHVLANRVHVDTHLAKPLYQWHRKADLACRELEIANGWQHGNGIFAIAPDPNTGALTIVRNHHLPAPSSRARDVELWSLKPSFQTWISTEPQRDFLAVIQGPNPTWQSVIDALAKSNLRYLPTTHDANIIDADTAHAARAHHLHPLAKRTTLELLMGPYNGATPTSQPERSYATDRATTVAASDADRALYDEYIADQRAWQSGPAQEREQIWDDYRKRRRTAIADAKTRARENAVPPADLGPEEARLYKAAQRTAARESLHVLRAQLKTEANALHREDRRLGKPPALFGTWKRQRQEPTDTDATIPLVLAPQRPIAASDDEPPAIARPGLSSAPAPYGRDYFRGSDRVLVDTGSRLQVTQPTRQNTADAIAIAGRRWPNEPLQASGTEQFVADVRRADDQITVAANAPERAQRPQRRQRYKR